MSRTTRTVLPPRVFALADDLSGAAEVAAALGLRGRILLGPATAPPRDGESVVLDLDTRQLPPADAASAVRAALAYADGGVVLKKIDSLLRGNLAAEAVAYATGARGVVIAPALPVAGRTVREGVVNLHGTALHTTDAWRAEPGAAPVSVGAALGGVPTRVVPLATVRAPEPALHDRLRAVVAEGYHPVCDAETDADLDAIAEAALRLGPGIRLMGTGGLAAALGRRLAQVDQASGSEVGAGLPGGDADRSTQADRHHPTGTETPGPARADDVSPAPDGIPSRPLLVVVGTAEPTAVAQIAQLVAAGARHVPLPAHTLTDRSTRPTLDIRTGVGRAPHGVTVVSIDGTQAVDPGAARGLAVGLAHAVAEAAHESDLVLTGGETARRVLDALAIRELLPLDQIHHGAVRSRTPDGRRVVTRPGSYGDTDSLLRIARALRPVLAPHPGLAPPFGQPAAPPVQPAPLGEPT
ncbi:four-carbon acid sugar kinase family protein [Streptomyces phaeochromogenes]|uniref:four-carbon acid sugar kinase family protein n=1 Tax=Streptomyces phaeochromogenes TaxID=1923 RepID=UPI002DD9ACBA|nr:four-carbon acid sugar kinase family protein [Streptomyces phaeochromogenes]WRZ35136.1 four-carbon acid sugar kinase family protein [Streptomyces phaeochromogenes]WSJ02957.1 four-carbon acid sugar kinase family protein [Streptomyces phaeochromogenes]